MTAREYATEQGITLAAARKRLQRLSRGGHGGCLSTPGQTDAAEDWTGRDRLPDADRDTDIECAACAALRMRLGAQEFDLAQHVLAERLAKIEISRAGASIQPAPTVGAWE